MPDGPQKPDLKKLAIALSGSVGGLENAVAVAAFERRSVDREMMGFDLALTYEESAGEWGFVVRCKQFPGISGHGPTVRVALKYFVWLMCEGVIPLGEQQLTNGSPGRDDDTPPSIH